MLYIPLHRLILLAFLATMVFSGCQCGGFVSSQCTVGERQCQGQKVMACRENQSGFEQVDTCSAGQVCLKGACQTGGLACSIGQKKCEQNSVLACKPDQSGFEKVATCGGEEVCASGECLDKNKQKCDPNEKRCSDNDIMLCKVDGSGFEKVTTCPKDQPCKDGICQPKPPSCKEDEKKCQGNDVLVCKPDQSGFTILGTCASSQVCKDGVCQPKPPSCKAGEKKCQGDDVLVCKSDGSEFEKLATCPTGQKCEQGECKPSTICTIGELKCQSNDVLVCKPDGSAFEKLLSCSSGLTCLEGKCVGGACQAGERKCSGNDVMVCNADRTGFVKERSCDVAWVTTFSGSGFFGIKNGPASTAQIHTVVSMTINPKGDLFIAEVNQHLIRKISQSGEVSTFAGTGVKGYRDGAALSAQFWDIGSVASDTSGNLYVGENGNHMIRKITPSGIISTFYRDPRSEFFHMTFDTQGNLYSYGGYEVIKITPSGKFTIIAGSGQGNKHISRIQALTVDQKGNLYFTKFGEYVIYKITPDGSTNIFAGTGVIGFRDGSLTTAQFNTPAGLTFDAQGNLYMSDNLRIRKITPAGIVSTIAGDGVNGLNNGPASTSRFGFIQSIVVDQQENIYVADKGNHVIRKIALAGMCQVDRCVPGKVCLAGTRKCQGDDVMICRADSSGYDKLITCPSGQTCQVDKCI